MRDVKSEVLAKKWAELIIAQSNEGEPFEDGELAAAKVLDEILDPPTLAGAVFEPLVGAATINGREVVTLSERGQGVIDCYYPGSGMVFPIDAIDLYPDGKKYKIVEDGATVSQHENVGDDQPEYPGTLCGEQDYQDAPIGTIVAANGGNVYLKTGDHSWCIAGVEGLDEGPIFGYMRTVLRWGWSK